MESSAPSKTSWLKRLKRAIRKRWAQVCIVGLVWLVAVSVSVRHYGPKKVEKATEADAEKYKFLHCDKCNTELSYNKELVGKPCPRCPAPNTGFYVPTEASIKSGSGAMSPWMKVYVATLVETVVMLAVVTFLLYRPVPDPTTAYFVVVCPYCNQRLRYRAVSHGGLGSCSRCKRMLRFPPEEDAVTEGEVLRADEAAARAEAEAVARAAEQE